jgi:hypothetical protein
MHNIIHLIRRHFKVTSLKLSKSGTLYVTTVKGLIRVSTHDKITYCNKEKVVADLRYSASDKMINKILGGVK